MRALLLAAGYGTRLQPFTQLLPKCLMPIQGRPLLELWLESLQAADISSVLINQHYASEQVTQWLEASRWHEHVRTVWEPEMLGTAGTLVHNADFFGEDPCLLVHADNLCLANLGRLRKAHEQRPEGTEITMMTFETPTPQSCGIVELDSQGIVQAFHEKVPNPPGNLANAAVYVVEPSVIKTLAFWNRPILDFSTEVLPHYLGKIATFHNGRYHRDIGNLQSWLQAQIEFPHISPPQNNGWETCLTNGAFEKLATMMADALGCQQQSWDAFLKQLHDNPWQNQLVTIEDLPTSQISKLHEFFETHPVQPRLLLIGKASPTFHSKTFFEQTGIASLVLCQTKN